MLFSQLNSLAFRTDNRKSKSNWTSEGLVEMEKFHVLLLYLTLESWFLYKENYFCCSVDCFKFFAGY